MAIARWVWPVSLLVGAGEFTPHKFVWWWATINSAHAYLPSTQDVPILIADAYDGVAVGQVLAQTKVVLAMSGPYALYGDKVPVSGVMEHTGTLELLPGSPLLLTSQSLAPVRWTPGLGSFSQQPEWSIIPHMTQHTGMTRSILPPGYDI